MKILLIGLALLLTLPSCTEPDQPSVSLYTAVQRRDINQLERHIHWGTDLNALDPDGNRAIHVAARLGYMSILELLLKHGMAADSTNAAGHTPVYYAVLAGKTQAADLLLRHGASLPADFLLLEAARLNISDRDVVDYLIRHGASTEAQGEEGDTPLLIAIRAGNHRLVRHLVSQGANVNASDARGQSALALAQAAGYVDIAQLLKTQGAVSSTARND